MPLNIRIPNPEAYAGAVLPHIPTMGEALADLPGFVGAWKSIDSEIGGWPAEYGLGTWQTPPAIADGVVRFTSGESSLISGVSDPASFPGLTFALRLRLNDLTTANQVLWNVSAGGNNERFTANPAFSTNGAFQWRNASAAAANVGIIDDKGAWKTVIFYKQGSDAAWLVQDDNEPQNAEPGTPVAMGITRLMFGAGSGTSGATGEFDVRKVLILSSGELATDNLNLIREYMVI